MVCGIVAYRGDRPALPALLAGLSRLEYRGYDSTGVALTPGSGPLRVHRQQGRLRDLLAILPTVGELDCLVGIAHTRWATHGAPSTENAHPHVDCTGDIAVVHNGTIENATQLADELDAAGHDLRSAVDTELVAHLIERHLRGMPATADLADRLVAAVAAAVGELRGSWALAVTATGLDGVVLARNRSPLLVGEGSGLRMAASDPLGFTTDVDELRELRDGEVVHIGATTTWFDRHGARIPTPARLPIVVPHTAVELDGSADFTAKEIAEQPRAAAHLVDTLVGRLADGELLRDLGVPTCRRVRMVACGSSYYAARIAAGMFASMAGVPASVVIASELATEVTEPGTLNIAFSQSGETADVLAAMDVLSGPWLAITNNPQSSLARRSDAVLGLGCGPEVGVAATKSFTAQVVAAAALATSFGSALRRVSRHRVRSVEQLLGTLPERLATTDERVAASAMALADELADTPAWLFVSRGLGVPYAMEGALKLKELSYRWVEALPAGELKHGPIALIQSGTPVVVVQAEPAERLAVSVSEMAARGARIITVGTGPGVELPVELARPKQPPWGPLESVVAMQHLAREVAVRLGKAVDRPRNLAKSVTVE